MKIEYAVSDKREAHIVRIGLLTTRTQYKRDSAGEIVRDLVTKQAVEEEVPVINEVLGRASHFKSLTPTQQLAYAQECEKWHHKRDATVRAKWDADDKARADAAAVQVKAEQEAKEVAARAEAEAIAAATAKEAYERFTVRALSIDGDKATVAITHHNVTIPATIPADPATVEQNARAAFAAYEAAEAEKAAKLAAFSVG